MQKILFNIRRCISKFASNLVYVKVGTLEDDGTNCRLKTSHRDYKLLPQGKLFICFSSNCSDYVLHTKNSLLLENLKSNQLIDWQTTAWNVAGHIDTFGKKYKAKNAIDKFAANADHIIFVVKDLIYKGLEHEWKHWTSHSQNKHIHLLMNYC